MSRLSNKKKKKRTAREKKTRGEKMLGCGKLSERTSKKKKKKKSLA